MRQAVALVSGVMAAGLGALIVGEYDFSGLKPVVIGVLFGLAVAEVVVWVGRPRDRWLAPAVGVLVAAGLVWAGWISVHHRGQNVPGGAWVAAALGAATAAVRTRAGTVRSGGSGSPPGS